jgi:hypothetical protein
MTLSTNPPRHKRIRPATASKASFVVRQEQTISNRSFAPTGAPHSLQERRYGRWSVNLNDPIEITDVDSKFESTRGYDDAVGCLRKRLLCLSPLIVIEGAMTNERAHA